MANTEANGSANQARRKLRLKPLTPQELPSHPLLSSQQKGSSHDVDLRTFVREVLDEAVHFSDTVVTTNFQKKGGAKSSPPSAAKVKVLSNELIKGEAWFARQSIHENAPLDGTASFDEFEAGLFDDHSPNEANYTPTIYETRKVLDWSEQIRDIQDDFGVEYEEVVMEIFEMCHEMPTPLTSRCFSPLVVRAFTRPGSFVVAQIPINMKGVPEAIYINGHHRTKMSGKKQAKVVVGKYTSVERVYEQDDSKIMWEMATASDAGGFLPLAVQKLGIPGAIVKDVGSFMKWMAERRKRLSTRKKHGEPEIVETNGTSNGVPESSAPQPTETEQQAAANIASSEQQIGTSVPSAAQPS